MAEVRIKETSSGLAVEVYENNSTGNKPLAELTCEGAKLTGQNRVSLDTSSASRGWKTKIKNQGPEQALDPT